MCHFQYHCMKQITLFRAKPLYTFQSVYLRLLHRSRTVLPGSCLFWADFCNVNAVRWAERGEQKKKNQSFTCFLIHTHKMQAAVVPREPNLTLKRTFLSWILWLQLSVLRKLLPDILKKIKPTQRFMQDQGLCCHQWLHCVCFPTLWKVGHSSHPTVTSCNYLHGNIQCGRSTLS